MSRTIATGEPGKLLTEWRADGTLHKDRYPCIYVYEQTYALPGTEEASDPAGLLRPPQARNVWARRRRPAARADALGAQRRPLPADEGDQRQHQPRGGAVRGSARGLGQGDEGNRGCAPGHRRDRRRRRSPPPLGRDRERTLRRSGPRPPGRGRTRADHHRRRPPPLRDGDPLPRRAARQPDRRGRPGLRLRADALPRDDPPEADRPADPPDRPRSRRRRRGELPVARPGAVRRRARRRARPARGRLRRGGQVSRRRGPVRALDPRRAAPFCEPAARRSPGSCRAAERPCAGST